MAEELVQPWLVVDDSDDSREAKKLFTNWCAKYNQGCKIFDHHEVSGSLEPPTLIWMGTYEGLYLIKRIVNLDPNVRYALQPLPEVEGAINK